MRMGLTVPDQKTSSGSNKVVIMGRDEIDVVEAGIVLPEAIHHEGRFILLDRQVWVPLLIDPRMPATTPQAVGAIAV